MVARWRVLPVGPFGGDERGFAGTGGNFGYGVIGEGAFGGG